MKLKHILKKNYMCIFGLSVFFSSTILLPSQLQAQSVEIPHSLAGATLIGCTDFQDADIYSDFGGTSGNYPNNQFSTMTFCAPAGETISFDFVLFDLELQFDVLTISNSISSDGPYTGISGPGLVSSAVGGCIDFLFSSDFSVTDIGWIANIGISNCTGPPPPPANTCDWTLTLFDSFGDGWNGGSLDVSIDGNAPTNYTLSDPPGFSQMFGLTVSDGGTLDQTYNAGSFDSEVSWTLMDDQGLTVFSQGPFPPSQFPTLPTACVPPVTCDWELQMFDSFGDGWNGASLDVSIDGGIPANYSATGSFSSATIAVTEGGTIDQTYNTGIFDGEVSWNLLDNCGNNVASYSGLPNPNPIAQVNSFCIDMCCMFDITCPIITLIEVNCLSDIPVIVDAEAEFLNLGGLINDSCNPVQVTFADVTIGNSTCPGNPTFVQRTFTITDPVTGENTSCLVTYEVEDLFAPIITCPPADLVLECGDPGNTLAINNWLGSVTAETYCGDPLIFIAFSYTPNNFPDCANTGTQIVTFSVTDVCGRLSQCTASIIIEDNLPPVIDCPSDFTITLDAGECGNEQFFNNPPAVDQCSGVTVEQTAGPVNGDFLERGTYSYEYTATDVCGNFSVCTFSVTVEEFPLEETTDNMACNTEINASLNENCQICITGDMMLEGGPYGCYDDFILESDQGYQVPANYGSGNYICFDASNINQTVTVSVINPDNNNTCWGTITIEDKFAPVLTCDTVTVSCVTGTDPNTPIVNGVLSGTSQDAEGMSWADGNTGDVVEATLEMSGAEPGAVVTGIEEVLVEIEHSWIGDLTLTLVSPSGTEVVLIQAPCGNEDNIQASFSMSGNAPSCNTCSDPGPHESCESSISCYALSGSLLPLGDFADFEEDSPNGTWKLRINDSTGGDGGCLKGFSFSNMTYTVPVAGPPLVEENCGPYGLEYFDNYLSLSDCDGQLIERTWEATDPSGNVGSCVQLITVAPPTIEDWPIPDPVIYLGCGDPIPGGVGEGDGPILCGTVISVYSDQVLPGCGGFCGLDMIKVIRTYTVIDWCDVSSGPVTYVQVIKRIDEEPPVITEITGDSIVTANPWDCTYSGPVPTAWVHDDCSETTSVTIYGPPGVSFDGFEVTDAPIGVHEFKYVASDCCGNTSSQTLSFVVEDAGAPVVVTTQNIAVSLITSNQDTFGVAKLFTWHIDNGSYDGCGPIHLEIRREIDDPSCGNENTLTGYNNNQTYDDSGHPQDNVEDTDEGEFVKFCCTDLTNITEDGVPYGEVKVWLRVWDDANMSGYFGDEIPDGNGGFIKDNYNEGWTMVRVEDKSTPFITCPPHVVLDCEQNPYDLGLTGVATATGVCGSEMVGYVDSGETDACNIGTIFRTWFVDLDGNDLLSAGEDFCTQQIIVEPVGGEFTANNITWPPDRTTDACNEVAPDEVILDNVTCSLVGWTSESDTFYFEEGSCWKVLNYYTVIDWCQFDEDDTDLNEFTESTDDGQIPGYWTYIQVIKFEDNEPPTVSCSDSMFNVDGECVNHHVVLFGSATDNGCDEETPTWIKWHVEVDLWGDGSVDVLWTSFNETHPDNPIIRNLPPTASGDEVELNFNQANISIPSSMSTHKVTWKVYDGCGNVRSCHSTFMVTDKKAPTPYCVSISTALMEDPDGEGPQVSMVEIWSCDFDLGAFDNCSDQETLWFTFSPTGPDPDYYAIPHYFNRANGNFQGFFTWPHPTQYVNGDWGFWNGENCEGGVFTQCGVQEVNIYVWDEKAQQAWLSELDHTSNIDFCTVELTIHGELCPEPVFCGNCFNDAVTSGLMGISNASNTVFRLDLVTMVMQTATLDPSFSGLWSLGVDPFNSNRFYFANGSKLYLGNFVTGESTEIGNTGIQATIVGLDFTTEGILLAVANDENVYEMDLATGQAEFLFETGLSTALDITFNDGELWISGGEEIAQFDMNGNILDSHPTETPARGITLEDCGIFYVCSGTALESFDPVSGLTNMMIDLGGIVCNDLDNYQLDNPIVVDYYVQRDCETGDVIGTFDEDGDPYTPMGCITSMDCPDDILRSMMAGMVTTELGEGVDGVSMTVLTDMVDYPKVETTVEGHYSFQENPKYHEYNINGSKVDDYLNGVSTLDLVLIQKHVLGLDLLDSPYKVVSADVNNDEKVSAMDLIELRKLILGLYNVLPNNDSWRFIDSDQNFSDPANPWPLQEVQFVNPLMEDAMYEDFIAAKIGDVNISAVANAASISSESRSNAKLRLEVADEMLEAGIARVEVTSTNFADIYGYQFTMNLSGASLLSVESGALEINDTNVGMLSSGVVTMSWNNTAGITAGSEEVLFTLVLEVGQRSSISEMLSISSKVTKAEAYVGNVLEVQGVELGLRGGEGELGVYELYQNEPNPFGVETMIGFDLAKSGTAELSIYDVTGKVLKIISGDFEKGYNQIRLSQSDIGISGILYYKLESGDFTKTRKMLVIY